MREGVEVYAVVGDGHRMGADVTRDDRGILDVRRILGGARELRGELTEAQVLRLFSNEVKRRRVPEARGATVAEQHFVAVGEREQRGESIADLTDFVLDGRLSVRRTEVRRCVRSESGDLLGANLRRA